jgi:hypothetical protein
MPPEPAAPLPPLAPAGEPPRQHDWSAVRVERVTVHDEPSAEASVHAYVHLGGLAPADVSVALMPVQAMTDDQLPEPPVARLHLRRTLGRDVYLFEARLPRAILAGPARLKVHVTPRGEPAVITPFSPPLGRWRLVPTA